MYVTFGRFFRAASGHDPGRTRDSCPEHYNPDLLRNTPVSYVDDRMTFWYFSTNFKQHGIVETQER